MAEKTRMGGPSTLPQLKPSVSQALWGHLLQKNIPPALRGGVPPASTTPMTPVDKTGTSMRMLLHDTQATLERFSGQVDKLTVRIDDAKREVATAHKVFQFGHEKLVEENVSLVNRCQTEVQKSLGKPAQAGKLEDTQNVIVSMDRAIQSLSNRVDALQMLNQSQLRALQVIQEQHVQLLNAITPVLPLLQSVPLHIQTAQNEIKDTLHQTLLVAPHQAKTVRRGRRKFRETDAEFSSPSLEGGSCSKRRRLDSSPFHSDRKYGSSQGPTDLSGSTINLPSSPLPGCLEYTISQRSFPSSPASHCRLTTLTTSGSARRSPSRHSHSCSPTPAHVPPFNFTVSACSSLSDLSATPLLGQRSNADYDGIPSENSCLRLSAVPAATSPICATKNLDPPASDSRLPVDATDYLPLTPKIPGDLVVEQPGVVPPSSIDEPGLRVPTCTPVSEYSVPNITPVSHKTPSRVSTNEPNTAFGDNDNTSPIAKPMSLKDRRARGLVVDSTLRNEGKRYIILDDEEEE